MILDRINMTLQKTHRSLSTCLLICLLIAAFNVLLFSCSGDDDEDSEAETPTATVEPTVTPTPTEFGNGFGTWIDTHMHVDVYTETGNKDAETAADNVVAMLDEQGVDMALLCVVRSRRNPAGGADFQDYLQAASYHPDRLGVMGGGSLLNTMLQSIPAAGVTEATQAAFESLAEQIFSTGVKGFGEMMSLHLCLGDTHSYQVAPADHPLFLTLADVADRNNVPIDLHMEVTHEEIDTPANLLGACSENPARLPASLPALERLLEYNRSAKIVWQHIGWDNIGFMTTELLNRMLGDHSNLYLSLRVEQRLNQVNSSDPMPNRIIDTSGNIKTEWLALFQAWPDRFVIGADEFVGPEGGGAFGVVSFDLTWAMVNKLPDELARKFGRDNTKFIYGFE